MVAITLSRQIGSLGDEIASAVGALLGFRVICRELINQAAAAAGYPEMALALIDDFGLLGMRPSKRCCASFAAAEREVYLQFIDQGHVVLVCGDGAVMLQELPDVLHIRIIAPANLRAQRLAAQHKISVAAALARVEASDRARRVFIRKQHRTCWDDPHLYDLIINTDKVTVPDAAALICAAVNRFAGAGSPQEERHVD